MWTEFPALGQEQQTGRAHRHSILSLATWVVGFEEETDRDHWRGLRQLLSYDPDQIQMLYVTPHRWTPYFRLAANRQVIQTDRRRWDRLAPRADHPPYEIPIRLSMGSPRIFMAF